MASTSKKPGFQELADEVLQAINSKLDKTGASVVRMPVLSGASIKKGDVVKLAHTGEVYRETALKYGVELGEPVYLNDNMYNNTYSKEYLISTNGTIVLKANKGTTTAGEDSSRVAFLATKYDGEFSRGVMKTDKANCANTLVGSMSKSHVLQWNMHDDYTFITYLPLSTNIEISVFTIDPITLEITRKLVQQLPSGSISDEAIGAYTISNGVSLLTYVSGTTKYLQPIKYDKASNTLNVGNRATLTGSNVNAGSKTGFAPMSNDYFLLAWRYNACYVVCARYNKESNDITLGTIQLYLTGDSSSSYVTLNPVYAGGDKVLLRSGYSMIEYDGYVVNRADLTLRKVSTSTVRLSGSWNVDDAMLLEEGLILAMRKSSSTYEKDEDITYRVVDFKTDQPFIVQEETVTSQAPGLTALKTTALVPGTNLITFVNVIDNTQPRIQGIYANLTNDESLFGIAIEDSANNQCTIAIGGIVSDLTGLKPGSYYTSKNGKLIITSRYSKHTIGKAISPTQLLVGRSV